MKYLIRLILISLAFISFSAQSAGLSRGIFTTEIKDKEPVSDLKQFSADTRRIFYFTELTGLNGHTITHRWEYNGQVMAEVKFEISGERWRTWSSKNMLPAWLGKWSVSVLDEGGNVIDQKEFEYVSQ